VVDQDRGASRRALLGSVGAVLAGSTAVALGGCGQSVKTGHKAVKQVALPVRRLDIKILGQALEIERRTVAAYIAGIPLLSHTQVKAAKQFLNEELQHTGELLALITASGGTPAPRAASYDIGGPPSDRAAVLRLLHSLESVQIANYLTVIPRLSPGPVRAAVASILANDAQHVAILRLAQGRPAMPSAFVTGTE
jgi:Ferritin-like domain